MKRLVGIASALVMLAAPMLSMAASPAQDLKNFRKFYTERFPDVPLNDYVNGVYALDKDSREQWEAFEDFPPYESFVEKGETLFNTPFKNGKGYINCFPNANRGIKQNYPYFDTARNELITLELAINECRTSNGEDKLKWKSGPIAHLSAYIAFKSRGKKSNVKVLSSAESMQWYERGKRIFYSKRGQLNLSCADCHMSNAGNRIRAEILGPALGQTTHFPAYRNKWAMASNQGDGMGTLQRRYGGCNKQVRAKPYKPQSKEYRSLEYFHTYMSNALILNGPGVRK